MKLLNKLACSPRRVVSGDLHEEQYNKLSKLQASASAKKILTKRENFILTYFDFLKGFLDHRGGVEVQAAKSSSSKMPEKPSTPVDTLTDDDETNFMHSQASLMFPAPSSSAMSGRKRKEVRQDFNMIIRGLQDMVERTSSA